jgi:hypothetical protein
MHRIIKINRSQALLRRPCKVRISGSGWLAKRGIVRGGHASPVVPQEKKI